MHAVSGFRAVIVCRERLRVLLPILVGALLTACVSGGIGSRAEGSELSGAEEDGSELFVSTNGELRRLGNIDPSRERTFSLAQLPFAVDGRDHYLVARPLAGESLRSEAFAFSLERTTVWTIENKTAMSRLAVR
jgi:hypothetical protein